mgnify:CR=1 FL=1
MSDMTRVALDAMGGDNAPVEMVKGAVEAVQKRNDIQVLLTGKEEILKEELAKYTYPDEKIHIVNATEVIETAEPPVKAIRSKKDSSLVTAMKLVRNGEADAFVSAGNSGAVLVGGQLLVGKIKGVERPPLAPLSFPFDRLRSECRCPTVSSCPVCKDGIYLYGERCR